MSWSACWRIWEQCPSQPPSSNTWSACSNRKLTRKWWVLDHMERMRTKKICKLDNTKQYHLFSYYRPHPKDGGRYCFQFVCQFTPRLGEVPPSASTGYPLPRSDWGYPLPRKEVPHPYLGRGYPRPDLGRGTPPPIIRWGYPHPDLVPGGGDTPQLEQHRVYLVRDGRYASCVHAGGLSYQKLKSWWKQSCL